MIGTGIKGDPARDPVIEKANSPTFGTTNNTMATARVGHRGLERENRARDGSTICTRRSNRKMTPIGVDGRDLAGPEEIVVVTVAAAATI